MGSNDDNLRRWWLVVVAIVSLVLVGAGAIVWTLISGLRATHDHVIYERAEELRNADAVGIAVFERSANARGFLLSGDASFLEARAAARADIATRLPRLIANSTGEAKQSAQAIAELLVRQDAASDRAMAQYATNHDAARQLWDDHARPIQSQIEDHIAHVLTAHQVGFESARTAAAETSRNTLRLFVWLLAALVLVIGMLVYAYARATRTLVAKLEEEQQQTTFRLIEQVPVGIFVITPDGKPYYANQHAKKLLGRGVERGEGRRRRIAATRPAPTGSIRTSARRSCAPSRARSPRLRTWSCATATTSSRSTSSARRSTTRAAS
jgi:CHASE3 domain sensor protein